MKSDLNTGQEKLSTKGKVILAGAMWLIFSIALLIKFRGDCEDQVYLNILLPLFSAYVTANTFLGAWYLGSFRYTVGSFKFYITVFMQILFVFMSILSLDSGYRGSEIVIFIAILWIIYYGSIFTFYRTAKKEIKQKN
jgi:uncharacterized membrane protein